MKPRQEGAAVAESESPAGRGTEVEYTRLGRTGLKVSRVGLGCMSYGDPGIGPHRWTLDERAALAAPYTPQDNYWW